MNVQRYNFLFKGIQCSVWIKALLGEKYEILIRSNQPLNELDREALKNYLFDEGYIHDGEEKVSFD